LLFDAILREMQRLHDHCRNNPTAGIMPEDMRSLVCATSDAGAMVLLAASATPAASTNVTDTLRMEVFFFAGRHTTKP
jgi:hypothetical protein